MIPWCFLRYILVSKMYRCKKNADVDVQGHVLILTFYWLFSFLRFFLRVPLQWKCTKLRFLSFPLIYSSSPQNFCSVPSKRDIISNYALKITWISNCWNVWYQKSKHFTNMKNLRVAKVGKREVGSLLTDFIHHKKWFSWSTGRVTWDIWPHPV